jgi:UDP-N-acetylmuramoyl-tripeptide--D-alanyl-D-alanine ligase
MEWVMNLGQAAIASSGELQNIGAETIIKSAASDSRKVQEGALFFALRGEKYDGHAFVKNAIAAGAACAVVSRMEPEFENLPLIVVKDTLSALGDIAAFYRDFFEIPIIGVTGSVGKTTTKDMIASVLSQKFKTLKTPENFNGQIGVPETIFSMTEADEIAVIEMGMSLSGEMTRLSKIARPDSAIITNIGMSHIGNFGSRENILKAKREILTAMPENGLLALCGDDKLLRNLHESVGLETVYYGIDNENCDVRATDIAHNPESSEFSLKLDGETARVKIKFPGIHYIYAALAAATIGIRYNVPAEKIIAGIESFANESGRQEIIRARDCVIVDDSYNASPASMNAAIDVLLRLAESEKNKWESVREIGIFGDMLELGDFAPQEHKKLGELAARKGLDFLVLIGDFAEYIREGAQAAGFLASNIKIYKNAEAAKAEIMNVLCVGDYALIKGSHGSRVSIIADFLRQNIVYDPQK